MNVVDWDWRTLCLVACVVGRELECLTLWRSCGRIDTVAVSCAMFSSQGTSQSVTIDLLRPSNWPTSQPESLAIKQCRAYINLTTILTTQHNTRANEKISQTRPDTPNPTKHNSTKMDVLRTPTPPSTVGSTTTKAPRGLPSLQLSSGGGVYSVEGVGCEREGGVTCE